MIERRPPLSRDRGFTLIELLIVIIVLGILVAIVLFGLGTFKEDSQAAACKSDAKQLRVAETAYLTKNPGGSASAAQLKSLGYIQDVPDKDTDGTVTPLEVSASGAGVVTVTPSCPT